MKRHSGPDGPGFWQLDGALFKRFQFGGSKYAEFRVDAYNVTNSVRWANPNTASAPRPATRSARSPARPGRSGRSGSEDGSRSKTV